MDEDEHVLSFHDEDSEDEADWEEVDVPFTGAQPQQDIAEYDPYGSVADALKPTENIEITIHARPKADDSTKCVAATRDATRSSWTLTRPSPSGRKG